MSNTPDSADPLEPYAHLMTRAFDISPPPGWVPLVARLLARIDAALAPDDREGFSVTQVKEKYGELRVYHNGGDVIEAMVDEADAEARRTCQLCGQAGKRRGGGWVAVLCDDDAAKEGAR